MSCHLRRFRLLSRPTFVRRIVASCLLVVYTCVAIGVPLPTVQLAKRSAERYPCEKCSCGCVSADQCWRSCCCHTPAQRIAWAKKNGVKPPDFVVQEARFLASAEITAKEELPPCCAAKLKPQPACCDAKSKCREPESKDSVVAWRALACHGQSLKWLAAPVTTVAVRLDSGDLLPPAEWLQSTGSILATGNSDEPAIPPPRSA